MNLVFPPLYCDTLSLASASLSLLAIAVASVHSFHCNRRRRRNAAKMTAVRAHRKLKSKPA